MGHQADQRPPFLGGPLQYARNRGIDDIVATLSALAEKHAEDGGHRFLPHPGFDELRGGQAA